MNNTTASATSSTGVEEAEGEESEEPSSSSSQHQQNKVEDALVTFRTQWQQELKSIPKVLSHQKNPKNNVTTIIKSKENEEEVAKNFFIKGIESEKAGQLYEAIEFYRKAVQLVPDIEYRLDYRPRYPATNDNNKEIKNEDETVYEETRNNSEDSESSDDDGNDEEQTIIEDKDQLFARIQRKVAKSGRLCMPKFGQDITHISALPPELLLCILKWVVSTDLDLRSLEMFGLVCRGFYVCARDAEIWKLTCLRIWGLNCGPSPEQYRTWRTMFIERPRLNFNGCYISKTTYIRHGENSFQDQFYRPWHLIAYNRYFRFFPEGIVLLLTSSEDPAQCVSQMKVRHPRNPVGVGYYRLKGDTVTIVVQRHPNKIVQQQSNNMKRSNRRINKETDYSEQTFHMELVIKNHKNRRHVKLVWSLYSIFTKSKQGHETTTHVDLIANRFPPLWFSRVKSFTSESDQPLN